MTKRSPHKKHRSISLTEEDDKLLDLIHAEILKTMDLDLTISAVVRMGIKELAKKYNLHAN